MVEEPSIKRVVLPTFVRSGNLFEGTEIKPTMGIFLDEKDREGKLLEEQQGLEEALDYEYYEYEDGEEITHDHLMSEEREKKQSNR